MFHMNNKFKKKLPPKPCISCKAAAAGLEPQLLFGSRRYWLAWRGLECAGLSAHLSVMRRDWPISTIRAVCSRCWKSMKMMRSRYCLRVNRFGSAKSPDGHYVIVSLDGSIALRFAPLVVAEDGSDEDSTLFPLVVVEDANGNHQRFVYHAGRSAAIRHRRQRLGVLTELRQCGGRAISLRRQQTSWPNGCLLTTTPIWWNATVWAVCSATPMRWGSTPIPLRGQIELEYMMLEKLLVHQTV